MYQIFKTASSISSVARFSWASSPPARIEIGVRRGSGRPTQRSAEVGTPESERKGKGETVE